MTRFGSATPRSRESPFRQRSNASPDHGAACRVVHVFVSCEATEHGLPQHTDKSMSAILAGSRIRERFSRHRAEAKRIIEFAIGEQPRVGGHDRTTKLEHQSAVEIEPEPALGRDVSPCVGSARSKFPILVTNYHVCPIRDRD